MFEDQPKIENFICHSGGAEGSDTYWEVLGEPFGVKTLAYSYKTSIHKSKNKIEISEIDYQEGVSEINKANKILSRYGIHKYMNLLARNWTQVKYSKQVFAIGLIVDPGRRGSRGYYNKSNFQVVDGGTGYAVQMAINHHREVFVFCQNQKSWFKWSYPSMSFVKLDFIPSITQSNFAGIGTRQITADGINAIQDVYNKTFKT
jgi:hypothetical protein